MIVSMAAADLAGRSTMVQSDKISLTRFERAKRDCIRNFAIGDDVLHIDSAAFSGAVAHTDQVSAPQHATAATRRLRSPDPGYSR